MMRTGSLQTFKPSRLIHLISYIHIHPILNNLNCTKIFPKFLIRPPRVSSKTYSSAYTYLPATILLINYRLLSLHLSRNLNLSLSSHLPSLKANLYHYYYLLLLPSLSKTNCPTFTFLPHSCHSDFISVRVQKQTSGSYGQDERDLRSFLLTSFRSSLLYHSP
jgi:hypothetical protein